MPFNKRYGNKATIRSGNNQYVKDGVSIKTVKERLEENRHVTAEGHWIWLGTPDSDGYGIISIDNRPNKVHRVAYKLYNGCDLDNDQLVLHKPPCVTRSCFNPEHLYLGDNKDNSADMKVTGTNYETNRTHCPKGHIYAGGNFRIIIDAKGGKHRKCIICDYEDSIKNNAKRTFA